MNWPGAGMKLWCPYCKNGKVWAYEDGTCGCVDGSPDAGGAPGCGAEWDCIGNSTIIPSVDSIESRWA